MSRIKTNDLELTTDIATVVVNDSAGETKKAVLPAGVNYKVYSALIEQSGTNTPTATVLENTTGKTITFERLSTGQYGVIFSGYDASKTMVLMSPYGFQLKLSIVDGGGLGSGNFRIFTFDAFDNSTTVDGYMFNTPLEIRIYE